MCSILELEAAISTVLCNILEFEPLIFPSTNICNILVLELFMSHGFLQLGFVRVGLRVGLVFVT